MLEDKLVTYFPMLNTLIRKIPWHAYFPRHEGSSAQTPRVAVKADHKAKLYHSQGVRDEVISAFRRSLGWAKSSTDTSDSIVLPTDNELRVHIDANNRLSVALNATGDSLHKRGWRQHVVETSCIETTAALCVRAAVAAMTNPNLTFPLKETKVAPAMPSRPPWTVFWDPFAGSGTIVLEALDAFYKLVDVLPRSFPFESWPTHNAQEYNSLLAELRSRNPSETGLSPRISIEPDNSKAKKAVSSSKISEGTSEATTQALQSSSSEFSRRALELAFPDDAPQHVLDHLRQDGMLQAKELLPLKGKLFPSIRFVGSDLREKALAACAHNAAAAGASDYTTFLKGDFEDVARTRWLRGATIVTNLPWGVNADTTQQEPTAVLYRRFGSMLRRRPDYASVFVLVVKDSGFQQTTGLRWNRLIEFNNHGVNSELLQLVRDEGAKNVKSHAHDDHGTESFITNPDLTVQRRKSRSFPGKKQSKPKSI